MELREKVLSRRCFADLPARATFDTPRALLMDWNVDDGVVTVVSIDDAVSLYFSWGGGVIGAGEHASVVAAAAAFRSEGTRAAKTMHPATDHALPAPGHVAFYAVWEEATLTSGPVAEQDVQRAEHPYATLGSAAQDLITAIRTATPPRPTTRAR
jgi:hypothetical protein